MILHYLDSSVLVAYSLEFDKHYPKAKHLMEQIKLGKLHAAISTLGMMETIDAIRRKMTKNATYKGSASSTDMNWLEIEIDKKVIRFLKGIGALIDQGYLDLTDPIKPMDKVFDEAYKVLLCSFGSIKNDQGFQQNPAQPTGYYYQGIGQYDVQHAIIAKNAKASSLITFDEGFRDLAKNVRFKGKITFDIR